MVSPTWIDAAGKAAQYGAARMTASGAAEGSASKTYLGQAASYGASALSSAAARRREAQQQEAPVEETEDSAGGEEKDGDHHFSHFQKEAVISAVGLGAVHAMMG